MLFLLFCCAGSIAQPVNLVPNGSFEDYIDFGNGAVEPKLWDLTLGTPDYFSAHFTFPFENFETPLNYYGFQIPRNSVSYMGIIVKYLPKPETREYLQIKLKDTLKKDSLYNISFWVNLPDSFHLACGEKNIAFAFSDTMVKSDLEVLDRLSPIYFSDSTWDPTNKSGWEKINKRIKAEGNEKYLIIGNFHSDALTQHINIGGGEKEAYKIQAYYFIDQVQIYKYLKIDTISPPTDIIEIKKLIIPNIFTPNADGINDVWKVSDPKMIKEISIYNRWGDFIRKLEEPGFIWEGNNRSPGIYFYKIKYTEKQVEKVKTGTITLIR